MSSPENPPIDPTLDLTPLNESTSLTPQQREELLGGIAGKTEIEPPQTD